MIKEMSRPQDTSTILCTLKGPIAVADAQTRNGTIYSSEVWDAVETSPDFLEMMKNSSMIIGIDHPEKATRSNIASIYKDTAGIVRTWDRQPSGEVITEIDVLDTPGGKIINTLARYGSKIGISTRANGDLDPKGKVKAKTYDFLGADFVTQPSQVKSRLQLVLNESIQAKPTEEDLDRVLKFSEDCTIEKEVLESIQSNITKRGNQMRKLLEGKNKDDIKTLVESLDKSEQKYVSITNDGCIRDFMTGRDTPILLAELNEGVAKVQTIEGALFEFKLKSNTLLEAKEDKKDDKKAWVKPWEKDENKDEKDKEDKKDDKKEVKEAKEGEKDEKDPEDKVKEKEEKEAKEPKEPKDDKMDKKDKMEMTKGKKKACEEVNKEDKKEVEEPKEPKEPKDDKMDKKDKELKEAYGNGDNSLGRQLIDEIKKNITDYIKYGHPGTVEKHAQFALKAAMETGMFDDLSIYGQKYAMKKAMEEYLVENRGLNEGINAEADGGVNITGDKAPGAKPMIKDGASKEITNPKGVKMREPVAKPDEGILVKGEKKKKDKQAQLKDMATEIITKFKKPGVGISVTPEDNITLENKQSNLIVTVYPTDNCTAFGVRQGSEFLESSVMEEGDDLLECIDIIFESYSKVNSTPRTVLEARGVKVDVGGSDEILLPGDIVQLKLGDAVITSIDNNIIAYKYIDTNEEVETDINSFKNAILGIVA